MSQAGDFLPYPKSFATDAIHHAQEPEQWDSMAAVIPIVTSTTFKKFGPTDCKKYQYGRASNPTRNVLENILAKLDNGKYGLAFSSGLGATTTLLGLVNSGEHIISGNDIYGGTNNLFQKVAVKFGIETTLVDFSGISNFEKNIKKNTKLVWIETPTNPAMQIVDINEVSKVAKKHNLIFVVDNTLLTSYLSKPLDHGADIVSYSVSKYMNGHSDVIMGALVTSNDRLYEELKFLQKVMGIIPSPFDCYQVNRGLKTLAVRMDKHKQNSLIVAQYLEDHPKVKKVLHPGLPTHPNYEIFKKQTSGHCGTFSFYIKGNAETSKAFLSALKIFILAGSLGGVESLAELPSAMSHALVPPELKKVLGITDTLIRVSVGIEEAEYLIADLEQAFNRL